MGFKGADDDEELSDRLTVAEESVERVKEAKRQRMQTPGVAARVKDDWLKNVLRELAEEVMTPELASQKDDLWYEAIPLQEVQQRVFEKMFDLLLEEYGDINEDTEAWKQIEAMAKQEATSAWESGMGGDMWETAMMESRMTFLGNLRQEMIETESNGSLDVERSNF